MNGPVRNLNAVIRNLEQQRHVLAERNSRLKLQLDALASGSDSPEPSTQLTVVITTSPIRSNPSTRMMEDILLSFQRVPGLFECEKIIVCDGCVTKSQRKHKAGVCTEEDLVNYLEYKSRLHRLVAERHPAFVNCRILEMPERVGYGLALRRALESTATRFVMVTQHDQTFLGPFDLGAVLSLLVRHPAKIKYIGMPTTAHPNYVAYYHSKFGIKLRLEQVDGVPLVPLPFWYDRTHICEVQRYTSFVFAEYQVDKKVQFIEDAVGKPQRVDIQRNGMQAHARYATYLLHNSPVDEPVSTPLVHHVHGRKYETEEQRRLHGWPSERRPSQMGK